MNRNILLFVIFCLGASAFLLVTHFRRANTTAATPQTSLSVQSLDDTPAPNLEPAAPSSATINSTAKVASTPLEPAPRAASATESTANSSAVTQPEPPDKYEVLRQLRAWAAKDPEAALQSVMSLPEGPERDEALSAVCFGLAQNDPADAVKLARDLRLDKQPVAIMEDLVQQWAATDLPSSLAWIEDQPAGAQRDEFTARAAFIMSQSTPADAATLVMKLPAGASRDEAIMIVLHQWANQNFVDAANWAKKVITGPLQERAFNELNGILEYQHSLAQQ